LLDQMIHRITALVEGLVVNKERMLENLEITYGALFSQRLLLAIVESGSSRDDAYRIAQRLAQQAWDERTPLRGLAEAEDLGLDLDTIFDAEAFVRHRAELVGRLDAIA
jgi:adenylosuccinate lyase